MTLRNCERESRTVLNPCFPAAYNVCGSQQCKMVKRLRGFVVSSDKLLFLYARSSPHCEMVNFRPHPPSPCTLRYSLGVNRASKVKHARARHGNSDNLERGAGKQRADNALNFRSTRFAERYGKGQLRNFVSRNTTCRMKQVLQSCALLFGYYLSYVITANFTLSRLGSITTGILNGSSLEEYLERENALLNERRHNFTKDAYMYNISF